MYCNNCAIGMSECWDAHKTEMLVFWNSGLRAGSRLDLRFTPAHGRIQDCLDGEIAERVWAKCEILAESYRKVTIGNGFCDLAKLRVHETQSDS